MDEFDEIKLFTGQVFRRQKPSRQFQNIWRWPWEYSEFEQKKSYFMKNKICERYLINVFDPDIKFADGYNKGYDFIQHYEGWETDLKYA
jgi:hypothetical protein